MGIFERQEVGEGGGMGLGAIEAAKESFAAPVTGMREEVSDDTLKWAERKLTEIVEGASIPDQERMLRMIETAESNREELIDLDRETFAALEREWEELRQGLQSGMNMTRENDEKKMEKLKMRMKALGARIESMRSEKDSWDSYVDRAKRYYRLSD